jgi:hypothetical protein
MLIKSSSNIVFMAREIIGDFSFIYNSLNSNVNNNNILHSLRTNSRLISENNKNRQSYQKYFILCDACLWCATLINNDITIYKCPACNNAKIESLSILDNMSCKIGDHLTGNLHTDLGFMLVVSKNS